MFVEYVQVDFAEIWRDFSWYVKELADWAVHHKEASVLVALAVVVFLCFILKSR